MEKRRTRRRAASPGPSVRREDSSGDNSIVSLLPEYFPEVDDEDNQSDSEIQAHYTAGGYCPVEIGDTFQNGRYRVLQKLGWGHFSTVWLCFDAKNKQHVAIKIQKSAQHYTDAARDEVVLLTCITRHARHKENHTVGLLDHFEHRSENGQHVCLVFEVLGKSLLALIKRCNYKAAPIPVVKIISRQILRALNFVHIECKIIHTDVKPENVLFVPPPEEYTRLCIQAAAAAEALARQSNDADGMADTRRIPSFVFRSASTTHPDRHFTEDIQTRQYRSPEVIVGYEYGSTADIWSLACLIFELATGDFLFEPQQGRDYARDEDHLALMIELLGQIPDELVQQGVYSADFFDADGGLLHIHSLRYWCLKDVLVEKYRFAPEDASELSNFLLPMLAFCPTTRCTASEAMSHPYLNLENPRQDQRLIGRSNSL